MKLSQTKGEGMPPRARRFWREVEATPPDPGCEDCDWPRTACRGCMDEAARALASAEAVC